MSHPPIMYAAVTAVVVIIIAASYFVVSTEKAPAAAQELQPASSYTSDSTGMPVEIYSGVITKVSKSSITLERDYRSKRFSIDQENPPDYIVGVLGNETAGRITLSRLPAIGDNVTHLFWVTSQSGKKQVTGVFINPN